MAYNRPIPNGDGKQRGSGGIHALMQAETALQVALVLPCAVCIGWLLGAWADSHFHTSWIAIAGILFGSLSGLAYIIRIAIAAMNGSGPLNPDGDRGAKNNRTK